MKKVLAIIALLLFLASAAFAENYISGEMYRNYGVIGYCLDLGAVGVQGLFSLNINMSDAKNTETDLDLLIGGRVYKGLLEGDNACLNSFAGVIIALEGSGIKDVNGNTDIEIQVGLQPEYFVTDNVSVSVLMGAKLVIAGDRGGRKDTGWTELGTFADPMANAVISWYFK